MTPYRYGFAEFISRIKDLEYLEMIQASEREAGDVEHNLYGRGKTARAKQESGGQEYRNLLGGFLFLLRHGAKPSSVNAGDFLRMRPAIESLVTRGTMKQDALLVFGEAARSAS